MDLDIADRIQFIVDVTASIKNVPQMSMQMLYPLVTMQPDSLPKLLCCARQLNTTPIKSTCKDNSWTIKANPFCYNDLE